MQLRYVTITGADDNVKYDQLWSLHKEFPFVEWAILFSQSKSGVDRYPSWDWVVGLLNFMQDGYALNLSAHLCGKWVSDVLDGNFTFFNMEQIGCFRRVQLNLGADRLKGALKNTAFLNAIRNVKKPVLLGGNYRGIKLDPDFFMDYGLFPLFDASGGHGVLAQEWPVTFPIESLMCGYAGGLGPENLKEQLDKICQVAAGSDVWVDMESKVRTGEKLDFNKVRRVLEIAKSWEFGHEDQVSDEVHS